METISEATDFVYKAFDDCASDTQRIMINPEELAKLLLAAQSVSDESRKAAEVELEKAGEVTAVLSW